MDKNIYRSGFVSKTVRQLMTAGLACCILVFMGASPLQAQPPADAFETIWWPTGPDYSITIPTYPGETYNFNIYWEEEGNTSNHGSSSGHTGDVTINFGAEGAYRVYINGIFPHFYLNGRSEGPKLQTVEQWGDIIWRSMAGAFSGATNLTVNATDAPVLTYVTDMSAMFKDASKFNQDISHWQVDSVRDMSYMFSYASIFNQDLNRWNVSKATNMEGMFYLAEAFNGNITGWNVGNVKNMKEMFYLTKAFNQDIGSWDVKNAINMAGMFAWTQKFNQNIGSWNVHKVELMREMFAFAARFNQDISQWNVAKVTDMHSMFRKAIAFNQPIGNWDVSDVEDMGLMFNDAPVFNQDLSGWDVSKVAIMAYMFKDAKSFNQNISTWNVSGVTDITNMFDNADAFDVVNYSALLDGWATLNGLSSNLDLGPIGSTASPTDYYSTVQTARNKLTNHYGWTITDGSSIAGYKLTYQADHATFLGDPVQYVAAGEDGTAVTVVPDHGFEFMGWLDGRTDNPRTDMNIMKDSILTVITDIDTASAFVTTWTAATITIPTFPGETYHYGIYWEEVDNPSNHGAYQDLTGDFSLDFGVEGTYRVYINGTFPHFHLQGSGQGSKLQTVEQWGAIIWRSMAGAFTGAVNLTVNATDTPILTYVTDMSRMFDGASKFNQDISHWQVDSVRDMSYMFSKASIFNQDLNRWNVSKVTTMEEMFYSAEAFNGNITGWNVGNVKNMEEMFRRAYVFNQDIGNWDVGEVKNMKWMFSRTKAFNQDLGRWNVSNVTKMRQMFEYADLFNQDISQWNVSKVTDMYCMFCSAPAFNQDIGGWNVSKVTNIAQIFKGAGSLDAANYSAILDGWAALNDLQEGLNLGTVGTVDSPASYYSTAQSARDKLTNVHKWIITDGGSIKGYKLTYQADHATFLGDPVQYVAAGEDGTAVTVVPDHGFEFLGWLDGRTDNPRTDKNIMKDSILTVITGMDTANAFVTTWTAAAITIPTYPGETYRYGVYWEDMDDPSNNGTYQGLTGDFSLDFGVEGTYHVYINGTFPHFHLQGSGEGSKLQTVEQWGNVIWRSMAGAFSGAVNLTVNATDAPILTYVTDMSAMFEEASKFDQNISHWKVDSIRDMSYMFSFASIFNQDLSGWDVDSVQNMSHMFEEAWLFNRPLNDWNVGHVTDMSYMFHDARAFDQDLNRWDVSKVTNMDRMFYSADVFNGDITSWNVANVTNMERMFRHALAFDQPIGGWDVHSLNDMRGMFSETDKFNQYIGDWNVSEVTDMYEVFENTALFNQDISNWNVSKVTCMNSMFRRAAAFNQFIGDWNVGEVTDMAAMFDGAKKFNQDLSGWDVSKVETIRRMFRFCNAFNQEIGSWDISNVTDMTDMYYGATAFDVASYSATLEGWAALGSLHSDLNTGIIGSISNPTNYYSTAQPARDKLTIDYKWIITDGGSIEGYKLTYQADHATFTGDTLQYVAAGEGGTAVTVVADAGFEFLGWLDGNTDNPRTDIDIRKDSTLTAIIGLDTANAFITTWTASSITIPTFPGKTYHYGVYWEEVGNSSNHGAHKNLTHDFTLDFGTDGTYRVYINGTFPHFYLKGSGDRSKLQTVEQWGNVIWCSMAGAFSGAVNLTVNATDAPILTYVTDMSAMFEEASKFDQNISHWKVDSVRDMSYMFSFASIFNQDLSGWDVDSVQNMSHMFKEAQLFNRPLNDWNVGRVTDMSYMFNGAKAFDQDLNSWDVSKVTNMSGMFWIAEVFNGNITAWNVENVTQMHRMFATTDEFNQKIGGWNVSGVTDMEKMFDTSESFNQYIGDWDVKNVTDMYGMFRDALVFDQPIGSWNVGKVKDMTSMFDDAEAFDQNIGSWNVSEVTSMYRMFDDAASFNRNLSEWDVSKVADMREMFNGAHSFNQGIGSWDVSNVTEMNRMFTDARAFDAASYSATLDGWAVLDSLQHGLKLDTVGAFHNPTQYYSTVVSAHDKLTNDYSWSMIDGGSTKGYKLIYRAGDNNLLLGDTVQYIAAGADGDSITVVPAKGYAFVNWSDGNTGKTRIDTSVSADIEVTAMVMPDNNPPVIMLSSYAPIYLGTGDRYNEPRAVAIDDFDGDISDNIMVGGDIVDTDAEGTYSVTYNVKDAAGNAAVQVELIVIVDFTPPVITLLGGNPTYVSQGGAYTEPGAIVTDNLNGLVSANIVIGGDSIDTHTEGTYMVTYSASDSSGNAAFQVERTVIVNALITSIEPLNKDKEMILYPNPARGEVHISFARHLDIQKILLFDLNGRLVRTFNAEESENGEMHTLDLSSYPPQTYLIQALDHHGQTFSKRLSVE